MEGETFSIGELARRTGLAPSALRHYEALGLLAPARTPGGRRLYDERGERAVRGVRLARSAGFTLREATGLLPTLLEGGCLAEPWRGRAAAKLGELQRIADDALAMKAQLEAAIACGCASLDECPLVPAGMTRLRVVQDDGKS